ncbi:MAG: NAD(P)-dependent glycerol-3-phosphate dehydrogenase [Oscillospiraceae bacterium]|nr:NAD(P)-dependent glycerol-3-phosphate dehydrogenase [Oscillospiraceae bacterium]
MSNIFILGCGFGTGLAVLWSNAGHTVTAYSNNADEVAAIMRDREHKRLLPGVAIPETVTFTADVSHAREADIVVFAVPSKFVEAVARDVAPYMSKDTVIVNVGKGFATDGRRLSQIIDAELAICGCRAATVLTGPCHAEEVGRGVPTTVVAAGGNAELIQTLLQTKTLRVYINDDIIGCELGGALKNPIALCCGIAVGMGLGDNATAALMTRGLAEIKRLGTALGADWRTFTGLAGVGDLIVTCTSEHSRNNRAGRLIGSGLSADEAVRQVGTVEGYECVKIGLELSRANGVSMPIFEELYKICYENLAPETALQNLMQRPQKHEKEDFW